MTIPFAYLAGMISAVFGLLGLAVMGIRSGKVRDQSWTLRQENRALREALAGCTCERAGAVHPRGES